MSARHDQEHPPAPAAFDRAFALGIALNIAFVAIEAFYGWKINSLALLADAGHNLSDVIGLVRHLAGDARADRADDARARRQQRGAYGDAAAASGTRDRCSLRPWPAKRRSWRPRPAAWRNEPASSPGSRERRSASRR